MRDGNEKKKLTKGSKRCRERVRETKYGEDRRERNTKDGKKDADGHRTGENVTEYSEVFQTVDF